MLHKCLATFTIIVLFMAIENWRSTEGPEGLKERRRGFKEGN